MIESLRKYRKDLILYNKHSIKKYADFKSRASRTELIYACLTHFLVFIIANSISEFIFNNDNIKDFILFPYFLFVFTPTLALLYRRFHDTNKDGWFILLPIATFVIISILASIITSNELILKIGEVILTLTLAYSIIPLVKEGDKHENNFGMPTDKLY